MNFLRYVYSVLCNKAFRRSSFVYPCNKDVFLNVMKDEGVLGGKRPGLYLCIYILFSMFRYHCDMFLDETRA